MMSKLITNLNAPSNFRTVTGLSIYRIITAWYHVVLPVYNACKCCELAINNIVATTLRTTMEDHTELNAEILGTLLGHKNQVSTKLHTIIKVLKPALNQEHIYLPEDKLLKYGIRRESMDLEQGGRFFKPMSQSVFETLPRLEEYYEEDGWDWDNEWVSTDDEIHDASHILVKLEGFIAGEIPNTPTDEWGCHRVLTDYADWDFAL